MRRTDTGTPPGLDGSDPATWWNLPHEIALSRLRANGQGLSATEAARRLAESGPNQLTRPEDEAWYSELLEELTEPMILLLLAVGVLYAIFGERRDAITILIVILITIVAELATEWRAKRSIAALGALRAPQTPVRRDGQVVAVPVETVVRGDIVLLEAGERVPADIRLLSSSALAADESALTGESTTADKRADAEVAPQAVLAERQTMMYAGTTVVRGQGTGVVIATGDKTELAKVAQLVAEVESVPTPLERELRRLSGVLIWVALSASLLVPMLLLTVARQPWREALLTGLTLAFATIPEELPILITAMLALGSFRLARRNAVVKTLQATETLGAVSVLVSDKTGTLTENRMTVAAVVDADGTRHPLTATDPVSLRAISIGLLANDAVSAERGDPTDRAFFAATASLGLDVDYERAAATIITAFPFSDATRSVAIHYRMGQEDRMAVKGAPEAVLAHCARVLTTQGEAQLQPEARGALLSLAESLATEGYRVLATAERLGHLPPETPREVAEANLTFVAFVLLQDPVRAGARDAVADLAAAGVRFIMVTGDHPATAAAVGRTLGLGDTTPVLGTALPAVERDGDQRLATFALNHPIVARATPEQKYRIVQALEGAGERVAVTGDGINDAPALARATVGVAMGQSGTDVAREAADLVLADDNIATVVSAVREARHLYDNLRKVIRFYLAVKVALILATVLPALVGIPIPFTPVQIILLELLMDLGASVSFVSEPPEGDVMRRPPRDPQARFLDRAMARMILLGGLSLATAVLLVYGWARQSGLDLVEASTAAFATWLVGHVVLALTFRSEREPLVRLGIFSNRVALLWMAVAVGVAILATTVPLLESALRTSTLPGRAWFFIILVSLAATFWIEVLKWWHWRSNQINSHRSMEEAR